MGQASRIGRNPIRALLIINLFALLIILFVTEGVLRMIGEKPGQIGDIMHYEKVDSLYAWDDYMVDELGIVRLSGAAITGTNDALCTKVSPPNKEKVFLDGLDHDLESSVMEVVQDFYHLRYGDSTTGEFAHYIQALKARSYDSLSTVERLNLRYASEPFNSDGFRSVPFDYVETDQPKVLLLGDSFTWGLSAYSITHSFADRLTARGYLVYNAGIIGTDPAQYLAIAQEYIARLKPDVVCVSYFMVNDHMYYPRIAKAGEHVNHITNGGWLYAHINGFYLPLEDCYEYIQTRVEVPYQEKSWFNYLCGRSVLSAKFWLLCQKLGGVYDFYDEHPEYQAQFDSVKVYDPPLSQQYLSSIESLCEKHGAKFMLSLIPDYDKLGEVTHEEARPIFPEMPYHYLESLTQDDFYCVRTDGHFNNQGMKKYADFLQSKIDSLLAE